MSIKLLVADDSITIQKVIGIIFGGGEYSLTIVDNGKSAVDKAREINPDILLIDVLMPGMSGYEVSEAVRSIPALADKPILLLTGSFEPFDEEKAKKCGADDFIAKPFESQQIISKVKELLELGKSREFSVETVQPPTPAYIFEEQLPEETSYIPKTMSSPFIEQQPAAPINIWSAFTAESEPEKVTEATVAFSGSSVEAFEPDVFAIVDEENDAEVVSTSVTAGASPQLTDSQWFPVEECAFEFEEETTVTPPLLDFSDRILPSEVNEPANVNEPAEANEFGDISFESEPALPIEPFFADFPEPAQPTEAVAADFPPLFDLAATAEITTVESVPAAATPVLLSEEQLKAAIMSASKEVIERIVWEVVPDLAEALILEAIRKIKQGV